MLESLFSLAGKRAVVTGASRGIGLAMAEALAAAGADITAVSTSIPAAGSLIQQRVERHGRSCDLHAVDFADRSAVHRFADELTTGDSIPDILVNNAGTIARAPAGEYSDADWDRVIEVDLSAHFVLTRAVGAAMAARGHGKIIFTASLLSYQGGVNVVAYAAAKSGIAGLTRALANEWAPLGVNVNAIVPGYIATDNTAPLRADAERERGLLARIPAGRWGRPEDLGGAAVYLAAPASDYVHGSLLVVDGGWLGR